jgi:hypothetical protein
MSLQHTELISSSHIPSSRISRSCDNSCFSFLMNLQIVFHTGCINLHSHWQCKEFSNTYLHLCNKDHFDRCEVIAHCDFISLIINDVEYFKNILGEVFFWEMSIQVTWLFWNWVVSLLLSSSYILEMKFLLNVWLANTFSHSTNGLFILLFPLQCRHFGFM